jgi:tRNA threonylcarbamoyl adenosine modification protein YeaZ
MPDWTLLLDTSQPELLLALCDAEGQIHRPNLEGVLAPEAAPNQHASRFFPVLERLLSDVGLSVASLPAVAINIGPGSFTGLRVGFAFLRMLAQFSPGLKHILPLSAFEILAASPSLRGQVVDIKLNAYRGQHYHAVCRVGSERAQLDSPMDGQMMWQQEPVIVANETLPEASQTPAVFVVDDSLLALLPPQEGVIRTSMLSLEYAEAMAFWVTTQPERFVSGLPEELLPQLLPNYMQLPHITVSARQKPF